MRFGYMKDYRDKEMKNLLLILAFLFLFWCTPFPSPEFMKSYPDESNYMILSNALESIIISSIISSATILGDCLVPSRWKNFLTNLWFPQPGGTIFSRIKNGKISDTRFQISKAQKVYSEVIQSLPSDSKDKTSFENQIWYKIYDKYHDRENVKQCQHDYLMCRDLCTETALFLVLYLFSILIFPTIILCSKKFICALIILTLLFIFCTRHKMHRFVNTVIAIDIANQPD